jgi:hypothetical protein
MAPSPYDPTIPIEVSAEEWIAILTSVPEDLVGPMAERAAHICRAMGTSYALGVRLHVSDPAMSTMHPTPTFFVEAVVNGSLAHEQIGPDTVALWNRRLAEHAVEHDPRYHAFVAGADAAFAYFEATLPEVARVPASAVSVEGFAPGGRVLLMVDERHFVAFERVEAARLIRDHVRVFPGIVAQIDPALLCEALQLPAQAEPWVEALDQLPDEEVITATIAALLPDGGLATLADMVATRASDWAPYLAGSVSRDAFTRETKTHLVVELLELAPGTVTELDAEEDEGDAPPGPETDA